MGCVSIRLSAQSCFPYLEWKSIFSIKELPLPIWIHFTSCSAAVSSSARLFLLVIKAFNASCPAWQAPFPAKLGRPQTKIFIIFTDRLISWDRGFDTNDTQGWGAERVGIFTSGNSNTFAGNPPKPFVTLLFFTKTPGVRVLLPYPGTPLSQTSIHLWYLHFLCNNYSKFAILIAQTWSRFQNFIHDISHINTLIYIT